jgi:hypothetical protein
MKAATDTPIILTKFTDLTDPERLAHILELREKREKPIRDYLALQAKIKADKTVTLNADQEKRLAQFITLSEKVERDILRLTELARKLRGIEIELEIL